MKCKTLTDTEASKLIMNLKVGDNVWNIGGVVEIVEIYAKGRSTTDGAIFCCFATKFGNDGTTITGSVREEDAMFVDGYLVNKNMIQFIPQIKI